MSHPTQKGHFRDVIPSQSLHYLHFFKYLDSAFRIQGSNYSISENYITSIICKIMEKLIRMPFLDHMIDNSFITNCQHGFVPR